MCLIHSKSSKPLTSRCGPASCYPRAEWGHRALAEARRLSTELTLPGATHPCLLAHTTPKQEAERRRQ